MCVCMCVSYGLRRACRWMDRYIRPGGRPSVRRWVVSWPHFVCQNPTVRLCVVSPPLLRNPGEGKEKEKKQVGGRNQKRRKERAGWEQGRVKSLIVFRVPVRPRTITRSVQGLGCMYSYVDLVGRYPDCLYPYGFPPPHPLVFCTPVPVPVGGRLCPVCLSLGLCVLVPLTPREAEDKWRPAGRTGLDSRLHRAGPPVLL